MNQKISGHGNLGFDGRLVRTASRTATDDRQLVARGFAVTATEAAFAGQETEAALQAEQFRYERKILDLNSEFALRRDALRREHLEAVAAISGGE